jgi:hypothetical protein
MRFKSREQGPRRASAASEHRALANADRRNAAAKAAMRQKQCRAGAPSSRCAHNSASRLSRERNNLGSRCPVGQQNHGSMIAVWQPIHLRVHRQMRAGHFPPENAPDAKRAKARIPFEIQASKSKGFHALERGTIGKPSAGDGPAGKRRSRVPDTRAGYGTGLELEWRRGCRIPIRNRPRPARQSQARRGRTRPGQACLGRSPRSRRRKSRRKNF